MRWPLVFLSVSCVSSSSSERTAVKAGAEPPGRYSSSNLVQSLYDDILPALAERHSTVLNLSTAAQWQERQAVVRPRLEALLGPFPSANRSATPKTIERGTVTGSGFTVQKLLVETRPRYFVPSALWLPQNHSGALPAILYAVGHEGPGFRWNGSDDWQNPGGDQIVQINLVKRGFAVLSFDPLGQGERQMYPDLTGGLGSYKSTFEHEFIARQIFLTGQSAASFWVWDMFILMDVLREHPDVDPSRLGDAGCSGGGMQVAYHAAVDPRVSVASIACYTSMFKVDFAPNGPDTAPMGGGGPADGEQTWPLAFASDAATLDKPDLIEIRAPRPTQVLLTTLDQCFPIAGGREAIAESRPAFAALGCPSNLATHEAVHWHGYVNGNREAAYGFLMEMLNNTSSGLGSKELYNITKSVYDPTLGYNRNIMPSPPYLPGEQLAVTSTGCVTSAPEINNGNGSLSVHDVVVDIAQRQISRLETLRNTDPSNFIRNIRSTAAAVAGMKPTFEEVILTRKSPILLRGEGRCTISVDVHQSSGGDVQNAVIYVSGTPSEAPNSSYHANRIEELVSAGYTVVEAVLCGLESGGVYDHSNKSTQNRAAADLAQGLNRSIVGIHAVDVMRVAHFVNTTQRQRLLAVLAHDQLASAVLHAAVVHPVAVPAVVVVGAVASYESVVLSRLYSLQDDYRQIFGVLRHYDIPDLIAAAGAPVFVAGATDAVHETLSFADATRIYRFPQRILSERFRLSLNSTMTETIHWLQTLQ